MSNTLARRLDALEAAEHGELRLIVAGLVDPARASESRHRVTFEGRDYESGLDESAAAFVARMQACAESRRMPGCLPTLFLTAADAEL